jgi:hypothetical protein
MIDPLQDVVAPIAIERAMGVYERLKDRDHAGLVQARKALTEHIYGLVCAGETDEYRTESNARRCGYSSRDDQ